jgi:outer membrane biosynthesis protein TonB
MRATRISFLTALLIAGPLLAGCSTSSNFDPTDAFDKLDFLNLNREDKLKGERKPLLPEGVPGVSQGIPQDLVKGHKPVETAVVAPVEEPPAEKPKPKPKPRVVKQTPPKPAPTRVQVSPAQQQQQPQQAQQQQQQGGTQSPWQEPPKPQASPWPDAPPPNTFQR